VVGTTQLEAPVKPLLFRIGIKAGSSWCRFETGDKYKSGFSDSKDGKLVSDSRRDDKQHFAGSLEVKIGYEFRSGTLCPSLTNGRNHLTYIAS